MKQVYSYQEIGTLFDQGKQVVFICHPEARVSTVQKHHDRDTVTVTVTLSIRDTCVGIVSYEYPSMLAVLDAFDIDEGGELWEVVRNQNERLTDEANSSGEDVQEAKKMELKHGIGLRSCHAPE